MKNLQKRKLMIKVCLVAVLYVSCLFSGAGAYYLLCLHHTLLALPLIVLEFLVGLKSCLLAFEVAREFGDL